MVSQNGLFYAAGKSLSALLFIGHRRQNMATLNLDSYIGKDLYSDGDVGLVLGLLTGS